MSSLIDAIDGVINASSPLEHTVTGGQPTSGHLEALANAGCQVVIDLRDPMEPRGLDEPSVVESFGMRYLSHPVSAATMTDETLDILRDALNGLEKTPKFIHCATAIRVGAVMIPYLVLDREYAEQDAVTAAMQMGGVTPPLVEWALSYTRRQQQ